MANNSNGLFTFLAGMAIGAAAVWLFTTERGEEVRQEMKDKLNEVKSNLEKQKDNDGRPA
ncbi:MAG: YtxH domain-containing protein [Paludibacteraceae bacterium]|nr:YtxH domain-containing protein [Paludibacteraceae bacterium]